MKKTIKRVVAICLLLVLCMSMLAGCKSGKKSNASKTYKLAISPYPAFYTWYICEAEDYFKARGVNVELVYFPVYSDSVQAFSTGQVDMIAMAMPDVIAPYVNGIDLKTVLILDNSNGADGLVATKDIKTIADLKGKSIATEYGTIEHFFLFNALKTAGLTEKDINFVNLTISDSAPAFLSGTVEAASLWEPSLSMALEKEDANLLISSADTPGLIVDVLVVSGDMAKNKKDDVTAVVNAYFDAMEFYCANPDKAIAEMAAGADISEDEMRVSMSGSKLFSVQECIDTMDNKADDYSYVPYTTDVIADFLKGINMIESVPKDSTKMYDSSYLKSVLKERGDVAAPDTTLK